MVKIKLCGLQTQEDIDLINAFPVDYAGFIFAKSKRQITPSQAQLLIKKLKHASAVGVFVNEDVCEIVRITKHCRLDIIQLHGKETNEDIQFLKQHTSCLIWKVVHIQNLGERCYVDTMSADRFLYDSYVEGQYGGSGKEIPAHLLDHYDVSHAILAGGINIHNIKEKLRYHPYGIDIASGVETNGKKDREKIERIFIEVNNI